MISCSWIRQLVKCTCEKQNERTFDELLRAQSMRAHRLQNLGIHTWHAHRTQDMHQSITPFFPLPLRLLPPLELLQYRHLPLQRPQPLPRRLVHLRGVVAQLGVEILPVRRGGHGGAEDGLHHEGVVGLQRAGVGGPEGGRELLGGGLQVRADAEGGEVQAAVCGEGGGGG